MDTIKIISLVVLISLLSRTIFAQSENEEKIFRIKHVESIYSVENDKEKGIFDKISSWLFGEESIRLNKPISLVSNNSDLITILDQGLFDVLRFDLDGRTVESTNSIFPSLVAICKYKNDQFLFTDSREGKIYILDSDHNTYPLNDSLKLHQPTGIGYVKSTDEIWVNETGNHSILILDNLGNIIRRIGDRGTQQTEFNYPTNIWIDENEKVYIVDAINYRIQIFDKYGQFISMFGEQGDATGYFGRPKGVATDSYGNIYVVDALFHTVQIFDKEGNYLSNFGEQGNKDGEFWLPNGLFIDKNNRIYVTDSYNSRIQIFQLVIK